MSNRMNAGNFACALFVLFYDSDGVARKRVDSYNGTRVRIPLGSPSAQPLGVQRVTQHHATHKRASCNRICNTFALFYRVLRTSFACPESPLFN
jgi:hypothetical protein